ncbi:MAG: iron ABC transporter permease, partial [Synergistaceae bacterium]|nr:iron ABC transporter permease [Synergistaceae bacterium]
ESSMYDEVYQPSDRLTVGGEVRRVLFAPAYDGETGDIIGTAIFLISSSDFDSFLTLMRGLFILALVIFTAVFAVATYSRDPVTGFIILGLFTIVAVFVAYPLFEAVRLTFVQEGRFSLEIWKSILSQKQYMNALRGSIELGIYTASASTAVGFLFAFVISRTAIRGKRVLSAIATLPVISPPFSLTLSIILLFGNNGLITRQLLSLEGFSIYGLGGLTVVQTMGMFPIAYLTMIGVLEGIDSTLEDAAMNLRATRWETFRTVTLPLSVPGLLSSWLLVFTNSLADFANPLILAGNFRVLSVESYMEVTGMNRLGHGAALSLLLLMPTLSAFLVQRYWVSRRSFVTVTGKPSARLTDLVSPGLKRVLLAVMFVIIAFLLSLYGTIIAGCFVKNWGIDYSFSLSNIREAFERGWRVLLDTLTLAGMATPIAGFLAMIAALVLTRKNFPGKKLLDMLILTPFALPGTLVGISYILAFNKAPLILVGTGAIIVINYVIRELPVGVEAGIVSLRQIDPSIEEAAADLGADVPTIFRTIVLPLVRPAFISSLSYTFVRSMTAVSAVIFLISAKWYHLTVQIYNFSECLRFGLASVLATTLIVIVLVTFGLLHILVRKNENLAKTVSN